MLSLPSDKRVLPSFFFVVSAVLPLLFSLSSASPYLLPRRRAFVSPLLRAAATC